MMMKCVVLCVFWWANFIYRQKVVCVVLLFELNWRGIKTIQYKVQYFFGWQRRRLSRRKNGGDGDLLYQQPVEQVSSLHFYSSVASNPGLSIAYH